MTTRSRVGFRSDRGPVLLGILLAVGITAIDGTILATSTTTIAAELGDFELFPWLFSAYFLTQAITVPVYSKLADTFGRKPIILTGIAIFVVGCLLCGLAWSMPILIAARALQGIGAGAIYPTSMTIVGDTYTVVERATVQGYIASVWAVSSVLGPTLGGTLSQFGLWRGIFFLNIPLCVFAAWLLWRSLHEDVPRREHRLDVAGALLLMGSVLTLLVGVLEGGRSWEWISWPSALCFGAGVVLIICFGMVERRVAEPVFPLRLLTQRLYASTIAMYVCLGAISMGLTTFVPPFIEGAVGTTPIVAGLTLAALSIGWPLAATLSGSVYLRIGFRPTTLLGAAIAVAASTTLLFFVWTPSIVLTAITCFAVGLGLGLKAPTTLIIAQSTTQWSERGVVTGAHMFARSIGSAVGVAIYGALATAVLRASGEVSPTADSIMNASGAAFAGIFVTIVLSGIAALTMPRDESTGVNTQSPK